MEFIPAIDLIDGQCVRLIQGDFDRQLSYGDPFATAKEIEAQGAGWLHLVDLDAARGRKGPNREVIKRLCGAVGIMVEVGGGIRSVDDASELIEAGASRVIIGTKAVEDPSIVNDIARRHPGKVAVGLDYRRIDGRREVALKGWIEGSGVEVFEILPELVERGATAVVATDISRDGTFAGPDIETLQQLVEYSSSSGIDIIASGGVSGVNDLVSLRNITYGGVSLLGVISGRAIHDGRLDIREAVAICRVSE